MSRLNLEEIKQIRRGSLQKLTFEEILHMQKGKRVRADLEDEGGSTLEAFSEAEIKVEAGENFTEKLPITESDVHKSLEQIIEERRIRKPKRFQQVFGDLNKPSTSSSTPLKEFKLSGEVDPMTNSLETIIQAAVDDADENAERGPIRKKRLTFADLKPQVARPLIEIPESIREEIKHIVTPFRALTLLNEKGIVYEMRIGSLTEEYDASTDEEIRGRLWRCEVRSGEVKGCCESERKVVAREMASHQFLQNIMAVFSNDAVPKHDVPKELFIDPKVKKLLEEKCKEEDVAVAHETRVVDSKSTEYYGKVYPVYLFETKYVLDGNVFTGYSSDENYAQLNAAKEAYEYITGAVYPPTKYYMQDEPSFAYDFNETMACQTVAKAESLVA